MMVLVSVVLWDRMDISDLVFVNPRPCIFEVSLPFCT